MPVQNRERSAPGSAGSDVCGPGEINRDWATVLVRYRQSVLVRISPVCGGELPKSYSGGCEILMSTWPLLRWGVDVMRYMLKREVPMRNLLEYKHTGTIPVLYGTVRARVSGRCHMVHVLWCDVISCIRTGFGEAHSSRINSPWREGVSWHLISSLPFSLQLLATNKRIPLSLAGFALRVC